MDRLREGLELLKKAFWPFVIGAGVMAFVGFNWGGWVTGGTAQQMASEQAKREVAKVTVPICIAQSKMDPKREKKIEAMEKESAWGGVRSELMESSGWATMPGSNKANSAAVEACMSELAKNFKSN